MQEDRIQAFAARAAAAAAEDTSALNPFAGDFEGARVYFRAQWARRRGLAWAKLVKVRYFMTEAEAAQKAAQKAARKRLAKEPAKQS